MSNLETYNKTKWVQHYYQVDNLQPAEATILYFLGKDLKDKTMLDIGVGGGRTTFHFAPRVKKYIGVDYSEGMVEACKKRFAGYPCDVTFEMCDAKSMSNFGDRTFDFVLFSFNGLDSLSPADRLTALGEIHRVGKNGSYFCFSTHNLQSAARIFEVDLRFLRHPRRAVKDCLRWFLLRYWHNRGLAIETLNSVEHALITDGALGYGLRLHYVKPSAQVAQLGAWFEDVRVFPPNTTAKTHLKHFHRQA